MKAFGMTPAGFLLALAEGDDLEALLSPPSGPRFEDILDALTENETGIQLLEDWLECSGEGMGIAERVAFGFHGECSQYCSL